jgi:uncharacterized membrane protein
MGIADQAKFGRLPHGRRQGTKAALEEEAMQESKNPKFDTAEITALSHLYRGEMYRSTVWRTRLDATTNWAVVTTGLALSLTFSSEAASPLPLVLVGLLVAVFLLIEGRRYRYFDFFRIRAHILEVYFFGPILRGQGVRVDNSWNATLYQDYIAPVLHITFFEAVGRRLRHNYGWIFFIQVTSYVGKLLIHPTPISSYDEFFARATIGPVPGQLVLLAGLVFHATWVTVAVMTYRSRRGADRARPQRPAKDAVLELARGG